jgi:hypothetical protein
MGADPMTIQECLEATDRELAHIHNLVRLRNFLADLLDENQGRTVHQPNHDEPLPAGMQADIGTLIGALDKLTRVARIKAVQ